MNLDFFLKWLEFDINDTQTWWQVGVTLLIILTVWGISHFIIKKLSTRFDHTERKLQKLSIRAAERIIAPLIALLFFVVARFIFSKYQLPDKILDIAIPLAISLAAIRLIVYILRKAFVTSPILKISENLIVFVVWGMFILHILELLPGFISTLDSLAISFGKTKISLLGAIKTILSVSVFVLIALWISNRIERRLTRSEQLANYLQIGIAKTVRVLALIIAFIIALDVIGIDLTALTVLGGALGVGIGFGLQRIASNFISGFILLFDRSIRPNDVITIGTSFGWVKELRARYVVIQDRDGVETLIPNENLVTSQVINWSYTDKNVRIKAPVQISYGDDPQLAMQVMVEAANTFERVLKDPPAVCRLMGFGDSGINLELRFWIDNPQDGVNNIRSDVNLAVWKAFKQNNITIPFPQRDVHMYPTSQS